MGTLSHDSGFNIQEKAPGLCPNMHLDWLCESQGKRWLILNKVEMSDFPWQNVAKRLPRHREVSLTECMCYARPQITTNPSSDDPDPGESQQKPSLMVIKNAGQQIPMVAVIFFFHSGADSKRYFYTTGSLSVQKHMLECQKCRNIVAVFKVKSKINLIIIICNQFKSG